MRIDFTNKELTELLLNQGIINKNQCVTATRRSQYRQAEGIVLFVEYQDNKEVKEE